MKRIKKVFMAVKEKSIKMFMTLVKKFMNLSKAKKIAVSSIAFMLIIALLATTILPGMNLFPDSLRCEFNKMYVRVGDSHIVRLTGIYDKRMETIENVSCVSSNKDILDTDGNKIIGMKPGKVKVTVKHWFKKVEIDVEVVPLQSAFQPSEEYLQAEYARFDKKSKEENDVNLNAVSDGEKVYVTWQQVKGAAKYIIYRSGDNKNFKKIYETEKSGPYIDKKAKNGENFYKIQAVDKKGKELSYKRVGINNDVISGINLKADNDKDGLKNIEELKLCTDMNKKDTDGDGIDDKKAVELFGAGTPVLNSDENSDVKQIEMNEIKTKEEKGLTKKGFESEDKKVVVEVAGDKEIKDADITLIERTDEFYKSHKGIIGKVNDIDFDGKGLKEARITLSYKDEDLNGAKEEDLKIYFLNEKDGKVEGAKGIKVDKLNKTVSGTVTHFSPYAIGDGKIFGDQPIADIRQVIEMVFVIDTSKKIDDAGGVDASTILLNRFSDYFEDLRYWGNDSKMGIVTFSEVPKVVVPLTESEQEFESAIANVKGTEGRSAIADGMMIGKNLFSSENTAKKLILVTDGKDENGIPGSELRKLAEVYGDTITINTIAYGENADNETMKDMAGLSGGIYFDIGKGVVDEEVEEIYAKISKQLLLSEMTKLPTTGGIKKSLYPGEYKGIDHPEAVKLLTDSGTNALTGNFVESCKDVNIELLGMNLEFDRTYNSDDSDRPGILGNGWTTGYESSLTVLPRYGKARKDFNIRVKPGTSAPIVYKADSGTILEYVTSGTSIATVTAEGKIWEKFKYDNTIFYVEKGVFQDMGQGVSVKYPTGSITTFKEGTANSAGTTEFISPFGVNDKLIYRDSKYYLIFKDRVNIYNSTGRLIQVGDKDGRILNLTYSGDKITEVKDQTGRKITISYDYKDMIYRVTDDLGRYVEYIRDENDNLTGVIDQAGYKTTYTYYDWKENYKLKEIIDYTNNTITKNEYDVLGRMTVQYYNGKARIHMYKDIFRDANDNVIPGYDKLISYYIDERGIESSVKFNPVTLKPITSTDADGKNVGYKHFIMFDGESTYTEITNVAEDDAVDKKLKTQQEKGNAKTKKEVKDRRGNKTTEEYDEHMNLVKSNDPAGEITVEYLDNGSTSNYSNYLQYFRTFAVESENAKNGGITTFEYLTGKATVKKVTDPIGNIIEYEYAADGSKAAELGFIVKKKEHMKSSSGIINDFKVETYEYDPTYVDRTKVTDTFGNATTQVFDAVGRVLTVTDAKGNTTEFTYDKLNRVIETKDPKSNTSKTEYDDMNRIKVEIDKEGNSAASKFDEFGNLIEFTDSLGHKTTYKYDSMKNKVSETDEQGRTRYFVYDKFNRLKSEINPLGDVITNEYDEEGNLVKTTDPNGYEVTNTYNNTNQVASTSTTYFELNPDGTKTEKVKELEYTYYPNGKVNTVIDIETGLSTKYEYDIIDRTKKEIKGYGLTGLENITTYGYDVEKRTEELGIEENMHVATITNVLNQTVTTYSDAAGRERITKLPTGTTSRTQYDEIGRVIKTVDGKGNETTFEYDELSQLTKTNFPDGTFTQKDYFPDGTIKWEKDPKGNTTSYLYSSRNEVTEVTDPQGRKTINEYNPTGTLKSVIDTWGSKTEYEYDELDRQIKTIDPMGNELIVEYDWKGNIIKEYGINDPTKTTEIIYDELYRPVVTKDRNGGQTYTKYDSAGNVLSATDPLGNTTTLNEYDIFGRLKKEILPGDASVSEGWKEYRYNTAGQLTETETSLGVMESFTYNSLGKIEESSTYPKDRPDEIVTESTEYDENGNVKKKTDGAGNITEYEYDNMNRVIEETQTAGTKTFETTYDYDDNGNLTQTTDYRGNTTTSIYDELNQVIETLDAYNNRIHKTEIYPEQRMTKKIDALGNTTTSYFDLNKREVKVKLPNGGENLTTYDKEGNVLTKKDPRGNTMTFQYDPMNRINKVINPLNEETILTYDLNGNMTSLTDGKGNATTYEYNIINQPTKRIDPGGKVGESYVAGKVESYTYRADGSLVSKIDRNNVNHDFQYDEFGRLITKTAGTKTQSFQYDKLGNLTKTTDDSGETEREYDELGRCTEKTVPVIGTSTYEYDIIDNLKPQEDGFTAEKTTDPKGNETLKVYDKVGRLARVTAGGKDTTYSYYINGALKEINRGNGSKSTYTYDNMNQLKELKTLTGTTVIEQFNYDYDLNGNMIKKIDRKGTTQYNYDVMNRLEQITEPGNKQISYTYDKAGNRKTQTVNNVTTTYDYNEQNRLVRTDDGTLEYKFYYDNNGNQTKQTKVEATAETVLLENVYNEFNQAVETTAGTNVIKNTYNADGLRVAKETNGTKVNYLYEGQQAVLETDDAGNETGRSVYGQHLISRTIGSTTYDYAYNGAGEITGLIDANGVMASTYYYDAFGVQTEKTGSINNPFTYKQYQYDEESELYYLNARYYNPETARFLTEDTYRGSAEDPLSLNLYTYCANNPVMYWDPTGHMYSSGDMYRAMSSYKASKVKEFFVKAGEKVGEVVGGVVGYLLGGKSGAKTGKVLGSKIGGTVGGMIADVVNNKKKPIDSSAGKDNTIKIPKEEAIETFELFVEYCDKAFILENTIEVTMKDKNLIRILPVKENVLKDLHLKFINNSIMQEYFPDIIELIEDEDYLSSEMICLIYDLLCRSSNFEKVLDEEIEKRVIKEKEEFDKSVWGKVFDVMQVVDDWGMATITSDPIPNAGPFIIFYADQAAGGIASAFGKTVKWGSGLFKSKKIETLLTKTDDIYAGVSKVDDLYDIHKSGEFIYNPLIEKVRFAKNPKTPIKSFVKDNNRLVNIADDIGKNDLIQKEIDNMVQKFISGNTNPGIGSKNIFSNVYELRGRMGGRVYYRMNDKTMEILAISNKGNQSQVINILRKMYE